MGYSFPPLCIGDEDSDGDLNGDTAVADVLRPILAVEDSTPPPPMLRCVNESLSRLTGETEDMEVMLACLCRC
jgi:hypothetical protein